jgi:hypothetical protein
MLSDADGFVTTLVSGGTIPTSVRVVARLRGNPGISTLSNVLVVSTGVPDQQHFSLATAIGNCEGKDFDQVCSTITVTLADRFGNPAPDGTAVNFSAEGGVIDASCITGTLPQTTPTGQTTNSRSGSGSGSCSVTLRSGRPRPANGRVTVLAYALGEENFFDANGNNRCDGCDTTGGTEFSAIHDRTLDIFRDDTENSLWTAGEPCIGPNANGTCSTPGDGRYNGVLRTPALDPSAQTVYIARQLVQLFSGSHANLNLVKPLTCTAAGTAEVQFTVTDDLGNVMPAGTRIDVGAAFGTTAAVVAPASFLVDNVLLGVGQTLSVPTYSALVSCPAAAAAGQVKMTVTAPNKIVTEAPFTIN